MTFEKKLHLGVYAVVIKEDKILLVKKARGPYVGKLDLPGGKIEHGESIKKALKRELEEETGVKANHFRLIDNFVFNIKFFYEKKGIFMHHVGLVYEGQLFNGDNLIKKMAFEDSFGADWFELKNLKKFKLSPFAQNAIEIVCRKIK